MALHDPDILVGGKGFALVGVEPAPCTGIDRVEPLIQYDQVAVVTDRLLVFVLALRAIECRRDVTLIAGRGGRRRSRTVRGNAIGRAVRLAAVGHTAARRVARRQRHRTWRRLRYGGLRRRWTQQHDGYRDGGDGKTADDGVE